MPSDISGPPTRPPNTDSTPSVKDAPSRSRMLTRNAIPRSTDVDVVLVQSDNCNPCLRSTPYTHQMPQTHADFPRDISIDPPKSQKKDNEVDDLGHIDAINNTSADDLTAFNIAFATSAGFFKWLEEGGVDERAERSLSIGTNSDTACLNSGKTIHEKRIVERLKSVSEPMKHINTSKMYRLERFSKAMSGTGAWEAPGAILYCE